MKNFGFRVQSLLTSWEVQGAGLSGSIDLTTYESPFSKIFPRDIDFI